MYAKNIALREKGLKYPSCPGQAHAIVSQMVRVLEKFLRDNPQNLGEKSGILAMVAFSEAFPCKD